MKSNLLLDRLFQKGMLREGVLPLDFTDPHQEGIQTQEFWKNSCRVDNSGVHVTVNGITGAGIRGRALEILLSPRPEPDLLPPLEAGDIRFRVFSGNQFCGRPGAFCPVFGIMGRDDCDARPVLQFEPVDSLHKCGEIGNKRRRRRD